MILRLAPNGRSLKNDTRTSLLLRLSLAVLALQIPVNALGRDRRSVPLRRLPPGSRWLLMVVTPVLFMLNPSVYPAGTIIYYSPVISFNPAMLTPLPSRLPRHNSQ